MKRVLGIIVSHRKLGNSELLVKEIMNNIPETCSRDLIRLTDLRIEPCRACYQCLQPEHDCLLKDDFNWLIGRIKTADALIIGVPVYILGPHGYYKLLTDRLVGVRNLLKYTRGKPCAIVIPYGTLGWEGYGKAASLIMPRLLQMQIVDCWMVHSTLPGEALLDAENLRYARTLGMEFFKGRKYQPGDGECHYCGSDLFRMRPGNKVECPICGTQGILESSNNVCFNSSGGPLRFSEREMEDHFGLWLDQMKKKFRLEKELLKEVQKPYLEMDWWIKP